MRAVSPMSICLHSRASRSTDVRSDRQQHGNAMIIDCHGHYTTEPKPLMDFRQQQIAAIKDKQGLPSFGSVKISDDAFRESVEGNQLRIQRERGTSLTLFSPRASGLGHHIGDAKDSLEW